MQWRPSESDEFARNQVHVSDKIRKAVAPSLMSKKTICSSDERPLEHLEKLCNTKGISAADVRDMVRAVGNTSALFEPMASWGFDVVLETPAEEAPDPESDGPRADGSGPDQATASEDSVEEQACPSHSAWAVNVARKALHEAGSCWRRPGLHYRRFTLLDQQEVSDPKTKSLLYGRLLLDCFLRPPELETSSSEGDAETCRTQSEPTGFWAATGYRQALLFAWLLYDSYWSPDGLVRLALL